MVRGAIKKYSSAISACFSKGDNFQMKYKSKKTNTEILHFDDLSYPSSINKIKNRYWFTTKDRKRTQITLQDIWKSEDGKKRGIEILKDKISGKYYFLYPIRVDWFPEGDRRVDKQSKYVSSKDKIISLDPGIRKFLVGYDPKGKALFIGAGSNKRLLKTLKRIDTLKSELEFKDAGNKEGLRKKILMLWKKSKNMVSDLHWKTISYLLKHYDTILLPDFRTSEMLKSKKLRSSTKRIMQAYSFHTFKSKLT